MRALREGGVMAVAYCWRTGEIGLSKRMPRGALQLGSGAMRTLQPAVSALARHAYDNKTLLVPGIPEADSDLDALEAARRFQIELSKRTAAGTSEVR